MGLMDSTIFPSGQTHRCLRGKGLTLGLLVATVPLGGTIMSRLVPGVLAPLGDFLEAP